MNLLKKSIAKSLLAAYSEIVLCDFGGKGMQDGFEWLWIGWVCATIFKDNIILHLTLYILIWKKLCNRLHINLDLPILPACHLVQSENQSTYLAEGDVNANITTLWKP